MTPTVIRGQLNNSNNNSQSSSSSPIVVMVSNNSKKLGALPESGLPSTGETSSSGSSQQLSVTKGETMQNSETIVNKSNRMDISNSNYDNTVHDVSWNNIGSSLKVKEERNQVLMNACFKTLELSAKNRQLQKELAELKEQTKAFVESVKATQAGAQTTTTSRTLIGFTTTTLSSSLSSSTQVPQTVPIQLSHQQQGTPLLLANGNLSPLNPLLLNLGYLNTALYNNSLLLKALGVGGNLNNTNTSSPVVTQSLNSSTNTTITPGRPALLNPTTMKKEVQFANPVSFLPAGPTGTTVKIERVERKKMEPICSCCCNDVVVESGSEDGSRSSMVRNYYEELNGMAQRWVKTLLSSYSRQSPPCSPALSTSSSASSALSSASNEANNKRNLKRMKGKANKFKTISSIEKSKIIFDNDSSSSSSSSSSPFLSSSSFKRKFNNSECSGGSHNKRLKSLSRLHLPSPTNSESSFISSLGISNMPLFGSSVDGYNGFDPIHALGSPDDLSTMTDQELFQQSPASSSNDDSIESS